MEVTIGSGDVENNEGKTSFSKSLLPEQVSELRSQRVRLERVRKIERDSIRESRRLAAELAGTQPTVPATAWAPAAAGPRQATTARWPKEDT